jgi:hypothetical protein
VLERRRSELESEQRASADARAEAERALQEARARRTELEDSLAGLRERVHREAEAERDRLVEAARARIQTEREMLKGELVSQRRAQARSLARDAAFAARDILVRLLEQMKGPDLEDAMQGAACRELEKLRSSGPLAPVIIESAGTLDTVALAALAEAAGVSAADADRRVNPELVVGLRVVTARGLVDVSAAGLAAEAERVLVSQLERAEPGRG